MFENIKNFLEYFSDNICLFETDEEKFCNVIGLDYNFGMCSSFIVTVQVQYFPEQLFAHLHFVRKNE